MKTLSQIKQYLLWFVQVVIGWLPIRNYRFAIEFHETKIFSWYTYHLSPAITFMYCIAKGGMHTCCKSFLSIIVNFHLIPIWSESKFSLFIVSLKWEKYVESFLFHDDFLLHTHTHIFPPLIGRSSSSFLVFSLPPCLVSLFALTQFYCVFCFSLPFLRFPFCLPFLVGSWNSKKEIA